jgi:hypothetical protein
MTNHDYSRTIQPAHILQLDWAIIDSADPRARSVVDTDVEAFIHELGRLGRVLTSVQVGTDSGHPLVTFIGTELDLEAIEMAYDDQAG